MAYNDFAYWYDALNDDADYDALAGHIIAALKAGGIANGLMADLGCGTGEVCMRLAAAGYDMIGVDASAEMLSVFRNKLMLAGGGDVLLLCQPLEDLDLYGTIRAAVSTFDTFNHLPPNALRAALGKISLFMEPGGLLIFDVNTLYKHERILGGNAFDLVADGDDALTCHWENRYDAVTGAVDIAVTGTRAGRELFAEQFREYAWPLEALEGWLAQAGFTVHSVVDGEDFGPPRPDSPRLLVTAVKQ